MGCSMPAGVRNARGEHVTREEKQVKKTIKNTRKKQAKHLYISLIFINFNYCND